MLLLLKCEQIQRVDVLASTKIRAILDLRFDEKH